MVDSLPLAIKSLPNHSNDYILATNQNDGTRLKKVQDTMGGVLVTGFN
jgi:hypothetical protein